MQAEQANHEHRPIFASNDVNITKLYRITSSAALFVDTAGTAYNEITNFFNFDVQFGRYRAITLQPGNLT